MNYSQMLAALHRCGSSDEDICHLGNGISPEAVEETVIVAPTWRPSKAGFQQSVYLSDSANALIQVWRVETPTPVTYIVPGLGASTVLDTILGLGISRCKRIFFIGSVGALSPDMALGDLVIPEYSISGDGASRYLVDGLMREHDVFGEKAFPDEALTARLSQSTAALCAKHHAAWHRARVFSTDSVLAEYVRLEEILSTGCNAIEMETAAAFRAAGFVGIPITALLRVSDNTLTGQTLLSCRSTADMEYKKLTREILYPKIIAACINS